MSDNPFLDAAGIPTPPVAPSSGGIDVAQLASAAEQKYGLPARVLGALVHVESHGDPKAVSPQGAEGVAQLLPATAHQLGVDPFNPAQAIDGAARYLKQGINATGSLSGGLMYYHGGPDTKIWGPKTRAYASNVLAAMGQQPEGGDPSTDASNPFLAALNGGSQGNDAAQAQPGNDSPDSRNVDLPPPDMAGRGVKPSSTDDSVAPNSANSGSGAGPSAPQLGFVQNALTNAQNLGAGLAHGFVQAPETLAGWTADALDKFGYHDRAQRIRGNIDWLDNGARQLAADPNSARFEIGNFGGEVAATAPLSEIKILQALGKAGKLAATLRYGDLIAQGAGAGALLSRGKDTLENAGIGGLAAGAGGVAIDKLAPYAMKAVESATGSKLAQALSKTMDEIRGSPEAAAESGEPTVSQRIMTGAQVEAAGEPVVQGGKVVAYRQPDGSMVWNVDITPKTDTTIPPEAMGSRGARTGLEAHNQMTPEVAQAYQKAIADGAAPDEALREADVIANGGSPTAAMVTRNPAMMQATEEGAKSSSIEGQALNRQKADNNAALHAAAQQMVADYGGAQAPGKAAQAAAQSLKKAADAEYGKVTAKYDAADAEAAERQAESDTQLASAQADADAASGAQAQVQARLELEDAQKALKASRSDPAVNTNKARKAVEDARAKLREATNNPPKALPVKRGATGGYINVRSLREALSDPEYANPTIEGVKSLRSGLLGQLDAYGKGSDLVNLQQAEKLRQAINDAYDPMGGKINAKVGSLKQALDSALDNADAGPKYKGARAAYKVWADKYDSPQGIRGLIKSDAKGNLINDDNWRTVDNMISSKSDKDFIQVVKQLKANGDTDTLNKFKSAILQDAYETATGRTGGNATDQLGNSLFSGKLFFSRLNKVGPEKLNALFGPQEIARLASLGRAATTINEAVPGTVNTSHTASAILNALKANGQKAASPAKKALETSMHVAAPLLGAILHGGEGAGFGVAADAARTGVQATWAAAAQRKAANDLAEGLKALTSPGTTRAAERAAEKKIADAARRAALARALSDQSAPVAAAASGGR